VPTNPNVINNAAAVIIIFFDTTFLSNTFILSVIEINNVILPIGFITINKDIEDFNRSLPNVLDILNSALNSAINLLKTSEYTGTKLFHTLNCSALTASDTNMIIVSMHKKVTMILFLAFISDLIEIVIIYKWLCGNHVLHTDRIWVLITIRQYNKLRG
jgi:hypothetical protein